MVLFWIASVILALLSLVLLVVALVSDNWVTVTNAEGRHLGLWKICVQQICILHPTRVPALGGGRGVGSSVCAMIALAVFTNADCQIFMSGMLSYSWSYGLGWLSFFLYLGTGAVTLLTPGSSYSRV
ncbi:unnamed protein product [Eretmochelys imbricata]